MRKLVVSESVTVDGFFDAETMCQWVTPSQSEERDAIIRETLIAADTLLLGRRTYDTYAWYYPNLKKNEYGIADRMNSIPKIVVTSSPLTAQWNNSTVIPGNPVDEISKLKQKSGKDILVLGSATLVGLLAQSNLADEYTLLIHPAIIGSGKRLFKDGMGTVQLKLIESKTLSSGVILAHYVTAR